ncbi:MAG TPA: decarboxylating 6-phosphogluconate dehydrogenase [Bacteroidales bacterium]|nr:decarboxylating 6-phosphogluconate dehydrogenase [Bacteroidales bacterium]
MKKTFFIIGLGKMGGNIAIQASEKDYTVYGYDTQGMDQSIKQKGVKELSELEKITSLDEGPRIVFLYVPAGIVVDKVINQLKDILEPGDILVDGGNSYWGDSINRYERLKKAGIHFIDCGTSGGITGARNGACFMAGGEKEAITMIEPILKSLSVEGGYTHTGPPGSGHFVKLVHNGIEFGMLQAIGEGIDLLTHYNQKLDIPEVLSCWRHGSVIRSWLVDLMHEVYKDKNGLDTIPSYVEDTGEVNWLVNDAMNMEVSTPVIAQSVMQLIASRDDENRWAKAIAMMRHGFGQHPFGPDESIAKEREEGRLSMHQEGFTKDEE